LFGSNASSGKLQTVHGTFHSLLVLGFGRSLVDKMEDASAGPSSSEIMHEIGIFKGSGTDGFASWRELEFYEEVLLWIHHRHCKLNWK
jgi:hypothetical protein